MAKSTVKYVDSMPEEARQFYLKKLEVCGPNQQFSVLPDPYTITSDLWSNDPSHWPDLQYGDVYNFLVYKTGTYTHEHMAAFKSLDGYNFFKSGHVQTVLFYEIPDTSCYCFLKAKVMPSQHVTKKPYEAWVCLNQTGAVHCAHCLCMSGHAQVCVHVAALLFKIEAAVKLGFTTRSSTSEACVWNKEFRSEIEMCSVSEMYEKGLIGSNRKLHVPTVTSSSRDPLPDVEMLKKLKECCPSAVFFTLIPKLDSDETDTLNPS